ncbi:MAG: beta-ketoacyl synthase chain length factor [Bacteroidetes bacterium]|nr:beta-ketoacyl synthase chain length factor [Bacteroidota bacterium]
MKQPTLFVHAATAISPQLSFGNEATLLPLLSVEDGKLFAQPIDYAHYISPVAIRRMSRIMKMTISAAMECLARAGLKSPDAILTGTGSGGITDMEQVVKDLRRLDEESLNPTGFIQSTYNSPNGWIAMQSGCTGYNQTYVHRGQSFELALKDAQMLLAESGPACNILAGCYEELTDEYFLIRGKRGYWKREKQDSIQLLQSKTQGTIAGEGASFFLLNGLQSGAFGKIEHLEIVQNVTPESIWNQASSLLLEAGLSFSDLSLLLLGKNGDNRQDSVYCSLLANSPKDLPAIAFKPLCGEYDTATGFGLWLGLRLLSGWLPEPELLIKEHIGLSGIPSSILLVNHFMRGGASLLLIRQQ